MKTETLRKFKKLFEAQRNGIKTNHSSIIYDDFKACADDRYDEIDQASADIEQAMRMQLKNREVIHMKKIEDALRRIDEGKFGLCAECGEDIELKRIEARPTATLCVSCKEEQERRETFSASTSYAHKVIYRSRVLT
jgi:DnaK suppressor protein